MLRGFLIMRGLPDPSEVHDIYRRILYSYSVNRRKQLFIFDFDGTIADSVPAALRIIEELGKEYALPEVDPAIIPELKHKSVRELMQMSGLSWMEIPGFMKKARLRFRDMIEDVLPIPGMPELIRHLTKQNTRMGILTSNREDNVRDFLRKYELEVFEFVESSAALFGKSRKLRKIMKTTGLQPEDLVMIGDEVRDINASKKTRITSVAVTWGFNSVELLTKSSPDHLVESSTQLAELLRELRSS